MFCLAPLRGTGAPRRRRRAALVGLPLTEADFGPMHLTGHYSNPPEALETLLDALRERALAVHLRLA
jgi:hypothetical protein